MFPSIGQRVKGKRIVYDDWGDVEGVVTKVDKYMSDGEVDALIYVQTDQGHEDWFGGDDYVVLAGPPTKEQLDAVQKKTHRRGRSNTNGWCTICQSYCWGDCQS